MPAMPRRRYKLFGVAAVVIIVLLYQVAQNSWDEPAGYGNLRTPAPLQPDPETVANTEPLGPPAPPPAAAAAPDKSHDDEQKASVGAGSGKSAEKEDPVGGDVAIPDLKHEAAPPKSSTAELLADKPKATPTDAQLELPAATTTENPSPDSDYSDLKWKNPPNVPQSGAEASKTDHWQPMTEHFPVSSVRALPTGTPKTIPKVQFDFKPETESAKTKRLQRLADVKAELQRTWVGYRKHAWMHDEVKPVSGSFKDPFCGWAATLVDSLDTLWLAGMKNEFDEAARAVKDIDFTYSTQSTIPVFETTIRYLGGLLAAFDVSGGKTGSYSLLLDKAVELADILMGIFDTPNRLPIMYYHWKPEFASQPHIAGNANLAELATLSLEFTRLAQLTGSNKYYDAVDRITDALIEMQTSGNTAIPGLFPQDMNVSGCNRTRDHPSPDGVSKKAQEQIEAKDALPEVEGYTPAHESTQKEKRHERRDASSSPAAVASDGKRIDDGCKPQGIIPLNTYWQQFHMGGASDSGYEYFPKEYLLLGGLESKYQKLHEDTVDAVNKWLIYRPMIKDQGWDILFPAKVNSAGKPEIDMSPQFEIAHLTCFIGGMYGLGGKIFGRDEDVERAKQLTDGCVWAYQATASGIMPEIARLIPCETLQQCEFNETVWWEALDPSKDSRPEQMAAWEASEEERRKEAEHELEQGLQVNRPESKDSEKLQAGEALMAMAENHDLDATSTSASPVAKRAAVPAVPAAAETEKSELPESLREKLDLNHIEEESGSSEQSTSSKGESKTKTAGDTQNEALSGKHASKQHGTAPASRSKAVQKPLTHEEFVQEVLAKEKLPPGFEKVMGHEYILRPEAIESVWYMYRITGDTTWQDKGWAMFEAVRLATRAEFGNSAVANVLEAEPTLRDSMESFWVAETLKYFFLLFSEPDVISLDEWVLNTEAHPFRRPS